jgi:hypothetical protein
MMLFIEHDGMWFYPPKENVRSASIYSFVWSQIRAISTMLELG